MFEPKVYGCNAKDEEIRKESSSGGLFTIIACEIINKSGIVYGVAMTPDCYAAEYIRINQKEELRKLRGSKYFQAKSHNAYKDVRNDLLNGETVLFSGLPCQINGLRYFLGKEFPNLILIDVICHGVPSRKLWEIYVKEQEKKYHSKIIKVNFRSKDNGWGNFGLSKTYEKRKRRVYIGKEDDTYMQLFLRDYCLRESCYNCISKRNEMSDIQLGDFWGVDIIAPNLNDNKGSSVVISRTRKGLELIQSILKYTDYEEITYEQAVKCNSAIVKSPERPKERETLFKDLKGMEFKKLADTYLKFSLKKKIKLFLQKTFIWKFLIILLGGVIEDSNYWIELTFRDK